MMREARQASTGTAMLAVDGRQLAEEEACRRQIPVTQCRSVAGVDK